MFSYCWWECQVPAELQSHVDVLDRHCAPEEALVAMRALLASDSTVARCMALDLFTRCEGQRQGDNLLAGVLHDEALAAVLRELREPPSEIPGSLPERGANHYSAMYAMWHVSDPSDPPLLARALEANKDEEAVLGMGIQAANERIRMEQHPDPSLVAFLHEYLRRPGADPRTQADALDALASHAGAAGEALLRESLDHPVLAIAATAALLLLQRTPDEYRERIAALSETWPPRGEVGPFAMYEVRRILDKGLDPDNDYDTTVWDDDTGLRVERGARNTSDDSDD